MNDVTIILLAQIPLLIYLLVNYREGRPQTSGFDEQKWNEAMRLKKAYGREGYRGNLDFLEKSPAVAPDSHERQQRRSIETTIQ